MFSFLISTTVLCKILVYKARKFHVNSLHEVLSANPTKIGVVNKGSPFIQYIIGLNVCKRKSSLAQIKENFVLDLLNKHVPKPIRN